MEIPREVLADAVRQASASATALALAVDDTDDGYEVVLSWDVTDPGQTDPERLWNTRFWPDRSVVVLLPVDLDELVKALVEAVVELRHQGLFADHFGRDVPVLLGRSTFRTGQDAAGLPAPRRGRPRVLQRRSVGRARSCRQRRVTVGGARLCGPGPR